MGGGVGGCLVKLPIVNSSPKDSDAVGLGVGSEDLLPNKPPRRC